MIDSHLPHPAIQRMMISGGCRHAVDPLPDYIDGWASTHTKPPAMSRFWFSSSGNIVWVRTPLVPKQQVVDALALMGFPIARARQAIQAGPRIFEIRFDPPQYTTDHWGEPEGFSGFLRMAKKVRIDGLVRPVQSGRLGFLGARAGGSFEWHALDQKFTGNYPETRTRTIARALGYGRQRPEATSEAA